MLCKNTLRSTIKNMDTTFPGPCITVSRFFSGDKNHLYTTLNRSPFRIETPIYESMMLSVYYFNFKKYSFVGPQDDFSYSWMTWITYSSP